MIELFQKLLDEIPDYDSFLTLEEMDASSKALVKKYPDIVSIFEMGRTRENRPLNCLKIGNGSKNALMFGLPHPNEPIGTMMLEYLTEKLAESKELRDVLDYTWYIVKAWDADGYALNEKWIKGPYTIYNYSRNFFRPAGQKQVDWTFPIQYKKMDFKDSIPETVAMMNLIDEIQPVFTYSLHNAGFGGTYWYVTEDIPELYEEIRGISIQEEVPLNLGEPEAPYCKAYAPAVYEMLGIKEEYDYLEEYGFENPAEHIPVGTCSADYSYNKYGTFTLLTELPYFFDKRIGDDSVSDTIRKDAIKSNMKFQKEANIYIRGTLAKTEKYLDSENPFMLALKAFTNESSNEATLKMIETQAEFSKQATVAEEFDSLLVAKFYKVLSYGMLVRANEIELEKMHESGEKNPEKENALKEAMEIAEKEHKKLADYLEANIEYDVIPIKKLIRIQLASGLLFAQKVHDK